MARARPLKLVSSFTITASDPPTVMRTSFSLIAGVSSALLGTAAAGAGLHVRTASAAAIVAGAAVGTAAAEAPEAPATPVPRDGLL
eukprot:scaffold12738_cov81-Phaeocystis_antarctica.AAC.7